MFFRDPKTFGVILSYLREAVFDPSDPSDASEIFDHLRLNDTFFATLCDLEATAPSTPLPSEIVRLNVRGTIFYTTLATLRSHSESLLANMFQEGELASAPKDDNGAYLVDRYTHIDPILIKLRNVRQFSEHVGYSRVVLVCIASFFRDPKTFRVILSYMRTDKVFPCDLSGDILSPALHNREATASSTPLGCDFVWLNVGGTLFCTSLTTLRSRPGSKLAKMFQDKETMASLIADDKPGVYFIDRYTLKSYTLKSDLIFRKW